MTAAVVLSAFLGIALGLQFRVLSLVPGAALAAAAMVIVGYSAGLTPQGLIGPVLTAIATIQLGYFCGGLGRSVLSHTPSELMTLRAAKRPRSYRPARQ